MKENACYFPVVNGIKRDSGTRDHFPLKYFSDY